MVTDSEVHMIVVMIPTNNINDDDDDDAGTAGSGYERKGSCRDARVGKYRPIARTGVKP